MVEIVETYWFILSLTMIIKTFKISGVNILKIHNEKLENLRKEAGIMKFTVEKSIINLPNYQWILY